MAGPILSPPSQGSVLKRRQMPGHRVPMGIQPRLAIHAQVQAACCRGENPILKNLPEVSIPGFRDFIMDGAHRAQVAREDEVSGIAGAFVDFPESPLPLYCRVKGGTLRIESACGKRQSRSKQECLLQSSCPIEHIDSSEIQRLNPAEPRRGFGLNELLGGNVSPVGPGEPEDVEWARP